MWNDGGLVGLNSGESVSEAEALRVNKKEQINFEAKRSMVRFFDVNHNMFTKDKGNKAVRRLRLISRIKWTVFFFFFINLSTNVFEVAYLDVLSRDKMAEYVDGMVSVATFQEQSRVGYSWVLQAYQINAGFYNDVLTAAERDTKMANAKREIAKCHKNIHAYLTNSSFWQMFTMVDNGYNSTTISHVNGYRSYEWVQSQDINRLVYSFYEIQPDIGA